MSVIVNGKRVSIQADEHHSNPNSNNRNQPLCTADMTLKELYDYFEIVKRRRDRHKAVVEALDRGECMPPM